MVISRALRKSGGGRQQVNLWLCEGQEDRITVVVVHGLGATLSCFRREIALVKCARQGFLEAKKANITSRIVQRVRTSCNDRLLQALLAVDSLSGKDALRSDNRLHRAITAKYDGKLAEKSSFCGFLKLSIM